LRRRTRRLPYTKRKKPSIHPYKSTLEVVVAKVLEEFKYEPKEAIVNYTVPHSYVPDFVHPNQRDVLLEVKGFMIKGQPDCLKYLSIIRDNPDKELVFVFSDPDKRCYPGCRMRKDGTYMSLGEWAKKNLILYFTVDNVPDEIRQGLWDVERVREYKREAYGIL
jgi:hypothetical protein